MSMDQIMKKGQVTSANELGVVTKVAAPILFNFEHGEEFRKNYSVYNEMYIIPLLNKLLY